jgi:hypothetical protein
MDRKCQSHFLPDRHVAKKEPCAAHLKTADGRRLCLGGPGATPGDADFVQVLQVGQTYAFPDPFLEHRKHKPEKP